jgi:hypothetical protein
MKGYLLPVYAELAKALRVDTKVLHTCLQDGQIEKWLKAITFFYSKPGGDASTLLTSADAMMMIEMHCMQLPFQAWIDGLTLTGKYLHRDGSVLKETKPKCDVVNLVKDGKYWKRPELVRALFQDINAVARAIVLANLDCMDEMLLQHDSMDSTAMACSEVVDSAQAYMTSLWAEKASNYLCSDSYVQVPTIYFKKDKLDMLRDKDQEISAAAGLPPGLFTDWLAKLPKDFGPVPDLVKSNTIGLKRSYAANV